MRKSTSHGIGNLLHSKKTDSGIEAVTESGKIRVIVFTDEIAKISLTRDEFDDFSYAVVASPVPTDFKFLEDASSIRLTTKKFCIIINKSPVHFRFATLENQVINEEEQGLYTSWIGDQVTAYKKLQDGERFIGLGEKTGPLDRKGAAYQNWNSDAYAYHSGSDPLYCSTPFYTGIHHDLVYGIFLDNSHKTFFNFGASNNRFASFSADYGVMNYFFIHDSSINQLIGHYTWLTGRMELPPMWSLGYQQCRYSYCPDAEVMAVARTFREKDIPADVIVLDIHYMDKYKIFTWDPKNFTNPRELIRSLLELGFQAVVMCDPGIKIEEGYEPYDDGRKQNVFLKYPDGVDYAGQVWPGWCHFPDFTNPKTRAWWQDKLKQYTDLGLSGFWNDMNEIATWGHALPENVEFDFEGNTTSSRRGRNVYGFQMARSTYEGAKKLLKGRRPFNLTRSGFSGAQRYGAVWTGDNVSYDEHMLLGVRLVNSMGLTGIAFAGYDAGGFVGEANTRLFARWISVAALSPFFRGHTMINTRDSEPWSFGEEVEQIARNFIKLRYQLMPYIYSLFHEAAETGRPIQRSLAIDFPFNSKVFSHAFHNQYLLGPNILVAPVESTREVVKVFFPEGEWYSIYSGQLYQGNQEEFIECPIHKLPVFVKGGGLLPMKKSGENTRSETEELFLHLYAGSRPSDFLLYEDDGETFNYQKGEFAKRLISFDPVEQKMILSPRDGDYPVHWKKMSIVYHGFTRFDVISINHKKIPVLLSDHSFFTPLEKYDPINEPESMGSEKVQIATFPCDDDEMAITW